MQNTSVFLANQYFAFTISSADNVTTLQQYTVQNRRSIFRPFQAAKNPVLIQAEIH